MVIFESNTYDKSLLVLWQNRNLFHEKIYFILLFKTFEKNLFSIFSTFQKNLTFEKTFFVLFQKYQIYKPILQ